MITRIALTALILVVTILGIVVELDRYRAQVCETSLAVQQPGCVGDWVSGGVYCNRKFVDINGKPYYVSSRAY